MRNTLFYIVALLFICVACKKSSMQDTSLTIEEYQEMGMPDHTRIWNFTDFSKAFGILLKVKADKPFSLPAKDSKKSGALYNRFISLENMFVLSDDRFPLQEKARWIQDFLRVYDELSDIYTNIRMKDQYYKRELVDIEIFGLSVTQKMLDLGYEIQESDKPEDIMMQEGFRAVHGIYLNGLLHVLDKQKHTSRYPQKDVEVLSDSLSAAVVRNKNLMDSAYLRDLQQALQVVIDSTSSDYIRVKYTELTEIL